MHNPEEKSYFQIIKSSALIGGSSMANIALGIVRTKAMALLLGPSGIGLLGLYGSVADLARGIAGMGINGSGVRQIAEAVGTGDDDRIARTVITLRRVSLVLGLVGALLLVGFKNQISRITFGDGSHTLQIALLGLVVLFGAVSSGQGALLLGMRRVADMARLTVLGAFYGTVFSVLVVYFYGENGVVPSLICTAFMAMAMSWWYSRKISVSHVPMQVAVVIGEASALLKLGVVFMASGLMSMGAAYLVQVFVLRHLGTDQVGFYQAAWAIGGLYVGFILQAMGADFFPRLTAVSRDNDHCNRLVNEQAEVSILLAGPGIIATLTLAPFVIHLFYSAEFEPAVEVLRWICLGMMLRVASWPVGFVLLAKGERNLFFWSELASWLFYVASVVVCIKWFGLIGTGVAFFALYIFYAIVIYFVARRLSGFRWSRANRRRALLITVLLGTVFSGWYILPQAAATIMGSGVTAVAVIWSLRELCQLMPVEKLPKPVRYAARTMKLIP